ncbi:lactate utilization protein B [Rubrivirga sp.]|uniref:lactate utilization protein B n=1 Tax=Rubrivirga sp. TaxID=1885344 RepID=UPI003B5210B6
MIPLPVLTHTAAPGPVDHAAAAATFTADAERTDWHDGALWHVREKRDRAVAQVPEWEALRATASAIKDHTLSHLAAYLEQFEAAATANGVTVHWARDAAEHNQIVGGILADAGATRLVKSKSMLTEECALNPFLEARGVEVVDTDLGERIVQFLDQDAASGDGVRVEAHGGGPSHIVMPAIHLKKEEVGRLFERRLGTAPGDADPTRLTRAARAHLRAHFLQADAALTGVNFAVAETGEAVVCTNEGNADLGVHLAPVQIHSMGIEKVIPRRADLGVFTRLLGRSATGQPITVYTAHYRRPRPGTAMHVVIVDNGRTEQLGRPAFRGSLKCIRCGACMNTCPVYRRSGGHSYGSTVPGPIGSILTPGLDLEKYAALPFASTLCGSCTAVCPVMIDIDAQLYAWRQVVADAGHAGRAKGLAMTVAGATLGGASRFSRLGRTARWALRRLPRWLTHARPNVWAQTRDLPEPPAQSFRQWVKAHRPDVE